MIIVIRQFPADGELFHQAAFDAALELEPHMTVRWPGGVTTALLQSVEVEPDGSSALFTLVLPDDPGGHPTLADIISPPIG